MSATAWTENQILTRLAPTLITEGLDLDRTKGFQVTISAESTRTLSGAGSLRCYYWNLALGRWVRNLEADLTITIAAATARDQTWRQEAALLPYGRVLYAADSVTVSGGTTVDVRIDAY